MERDNEINELLHLLSLHGGEIVCSASLDTNDINQARASGRMVVTENNIGFVWMPKFKFPTTDKEVEFFEKWFPLDVEMPDKFNDPDYIQKNIVDKVGNKDKLIEKIREKLHYELSGREDAMVYITKEGADYILTSLTAPVPDGKEEREKIVLECRDELLKHMFLMVHDNGYPSRAVPHATILELPALMKLTKTPDAG